MNDCPLVSIVVPVYNSAQYLEPCLSALIEQTYKNLQIILVNDGSTDDSETICQSFAAKDPRILYLRKENGGASSARNVGIEKATGKYLYFADSDDFLERTAISELTAFAEQQQADCVIFEANNFTDAYDKKIQKNSYSMRFSYPVCSGNELLLKLMDHKDYHASPVLYFMHRAILAQDLTFSEGIMFEDELFIFQMLRRCKTVSCLRKVLYHRCIHPGSVTTATGQNLYRFKSMSRVFRGVYALLPTSGKTPDESLRRYLVRIGLLWLCIYEAMTEEEQKTVCTEANAIKEIMRRHNGFGSRELLVRCRSHLLWMIYVFPGRVIKVTNRRIKQMLGEMKHDRCDDIQCS